MKNFEMAFDKIQKIEGKGWTDNKNDKGGETYAGITKKHNKNWAGWKIIDEYKKKENFPSNLQLVPELKVLVKAFYKSKEWDAIRGDDLPYMIAEELFDIEVNTGQAIRFLQRSLNILNRNKKFWKNIKVDGKFGTKTFEVLKKCLSTIGTTKLFNMLNHFQANHYIAIMEKDETQEKWVGWFNRVNFVNKGR